MEPKIMAMKRGLRDALEEWLGCDVPDEDSDDFEVWQARKLEIEAVRTFADVYACLDNDDNRAADFFARYGIDDFRSVI
jgi:hypothetical protein